MIEAKAVQDFVAGPRVIGKAQRLLEPRAVAGLDVFIGGEDRALNLVEPALIVKERNGRVAAVLARDAELTAEVPVDAMRDVDLHLAVTLQLLDRELHDRGLAKVRPREIGDRHRIAAAFLLERIDSGADLD